MQKEKDDEHDVRIDALYSKEREQEFKLKAQVAKDAEHDFRLNSVDSKNVEQDSELKRQRVKDNEHDSRLERLEKLCADLALRVDALESQLKDLQK
jgi:hypothetical protein